MTLIMTINATKTFQRKSKGNMKNKIKIITDNPLGESKLNTVECGTNFEANTNFFYTQNKKRETNN